MNIYYKKCASIFVWGDAVDISLVSFGSYILHYLILLHSSFIFSWVFAG